MKSIYKLISVTVVFAVVIFVGCQDRSELTAPAAPNIGNVSLDRYVTMGNSLTAGYQSGSLFQSAQMYSYGAQIAKLVGVTYQQAFLSDPGSGGRVEVASVSPFALKVNTGQGVPTNLNYPAPYNNLGVPGSFVYDMVNTTASANSYSAKGGSVNPLFDLVLRGQGSEFKQAKLQKPTLLSCWIGNNDVLGYATSGGTLPLTDVPTFTFLYSQLADSLASLKTKVVIANIPSVTSIPYFTTVPAALRDPGTGAIITLYGETTTGVRALVPGQDLLTLPASQVLLGATGQPTGIGLSPTKPIPTKYVLDKDEVTKVKNAIAAFNTVIANAASAKGFGLFDANTFFNSVAAGGINVDGLHLTTDFGLGGLFSLDGVHPTSTGYAVVANEFIKVINAKFGGQIPFVSVSKVPPSIVLAKQVKMSSYGIPIIAPGSLDKVLF